MNNLVEIGGINCEDNIQLCTELGYINNFPLVKAYGYGPKDLKGG